MSGAPFDDLAVTIPEAWAVQNELGASIEHDRRCSSVPESHPLAGPHFLCDCGAVELVAKQRKAGLG